MNKERLLNVAKALRESPAPEKFDMEQYGLQSCGSPACALGHYADRPDLQNFMTLERSSATTICLVPTRSTRISTGVSTSLHFDDRVMCSHFNISVETSMDLFGTDGCGGAETPEEAAEYIEQYCNSNTESD